MWLEHVKIWLVQNNNNKKKERLWWPHARSIQMHSCKYPFDLPLFYMRVFLLFFYSCKFFSILYFAIVLFQIVGKFLSNFYVSFTTKHLGSNLSYPIFMFFFNSLFYIWVPKTFEFLFKCKNSQACKARRMSINILKNILHLCLMVTCVRNAT